VQISQHNFIIAPQYIVGDVAMFINHIAISQHPWSKEYWDWNKKAIMFCSEPSLECYFAEIGKFSSAMSYQCKVITVFHRYWHSFSLITINQHLFDLYARLVIRPVNIQWLKCVVFYDICLAGLRSAKRCRILFRGGSQILGMCPPVFLLQSSWMLSAPTFR